MFYTISHFTRLSVTTGFYSTSNTEAIALSEKIAAANPGPLVLLGSHSYEDKSRLKSVFMQKWVSQDAYNAWRTANVALLNQYDSERAAFNTANGITVSEVDITTDEILF
jgi:hypothetical protein